VDAHGVRGHEREERRVELREERHRVLVEVAPVALGQDGLEEGEVGNELADLREGLGLFACGCGWLLWWWVMGGVGWL
jgi:hypothetical protein